MNNRKSDVGGLLRVVYHVAADHVSKQDLSDNLLKRLSGFIDEVERLSDDIVQNAGTGSIWADRKDGKSEIVKSSVEQLRHLAGEFESLSKFIDKRYHDKAIASSISALVSSLASLSKSSGGVKKLFSGSDDFIEVLREKHEEVQNRIRACRKSIERLQKADDPLADFDFGPPE